MSILFLPSLIPNPILLGSGVIIGSALSVDPGPNWISTSPLDLKRDTNLLGTFFSFKR